jgi:hypothetical protein
MRVMRRRLSTYWSYSVACAFVWAAILVAVSSMSGAATRHTFFLLCGGWVIGWLSATIARSVYPPPRRHAGQ